jgi:hypothetical protein
MKHPLLANRFLISKYPQPLLSNAFANKQVPTANISRATMEELLEAGSNTSTVVLRVVGGDEEGSLESERVGLGPENDCAGEGQQQL